MKITAAIIRDPQAPYSTEQLDLAGAGSGEVLARIAEQSSSSGGVLKPVLLGPT